MKKVYCYIEVPDDCPNLNLAFSLWVSETLRRMKVGLYPQIELYQMEEAEG